MVVGWRDGTTDAVEVALCGIGPYETARDMVDGVIVALSDAGWRVLVEQRVMSRGDGRSGRVDVIATRGAEVVAIECDRLTPRAKSIHKLRHVSATGRLVLLRGRRE